VVQRREGINQNGLTYGPSAIFNSINLNIRAFMPPGCVSCVPLLRPKEETSVSPVAFQLILPRPLFIRRKRMNILLPSQVGKGE
jgi:hypothetical protein